MRTPLALPSPRLRFTCARRYARRHPPRPSRRHRATLRPPRPDVPARCTPPRILARLLSLTDPRVHTVRAAPSACLALRAPLRPLAARVRSRPARSILWHPRPLPRPRLLTIPMRALAPRRSRLYTARRRRDHSCVRSHRAAPRAPTSRTLTRRSIAIPTAPTRPSLAVIIARHATRAADSGSRVCAPRLPIPVLRSPTMTTRLVATRPMPVCARRTPVCCPRTPFCTTTCTPICPAIPTPTPTRAATPTATPTRTPALTPIPSPPILRPCPRCSSGTRTPLCSPGSLSSAAARPRRPTGGALAPPALPRLPQLPLPPLLQSCQVLTANAHHLENRQTAVDLRTPTSDEAKRGSVDTKGVGSAVVGSAVGRAKSDCRVRATKQRGSSPVRREVDEYVARELGTVQHKLLGCRMDVTCREGAQLAPVCGV